MGSVYLDHNATTPVRPQAAQAVAEALAAVGNPSSVHGPGRAARRRVETAREAVAALVGACAEEVAFTSGGTEANALVLAGSGRPRLLVSAIEHESVLRARPDAEPIPVATDGRVIVEAVSAMLAADPRPALVSVMLANNETGVIQPVAEIAARARAQGALVHCDASQAAGKLPVSAVELGADFLTLSAHKLGGPQGVGAVVVAGEADLLPLLVGGGQERGRRAGTENVPGIAGFGVAARLAAEGLEDFARLAAWRDAMERRLAARVIGGAAARLANTSCLVMPGMSAEVQVMALDLEGVAVSAGAACSSGKVRASHVLAAMGIPDEAARCAIRVSLGWNSTEADMDRFVAAWTAVAARAAGKAA